jgi:hypothetical protein
LNLMIMIKEKRTLLDESQKKRRKELREDKE